MSIDRRAMLVGGVAAVLAASAASVTAAGRRRFFDARRRVGLQLYTLGEEPGRDLADTLARVAAIGFRDIELPGLYGRAPKAVRAAADAAGVTLTSLHLPIGPRVLPGSLLITADTQRLVDTLGTLGTRQAVVPLMMMPELMPRTPDEPFQSALPRAIAAAGPDIWKRTADLLNRRAAALKPFGIALGYHNHNVEFAPIGGTTGWAIIERETDPGLVHFEIDIGWLAAAGLDPADFLRRHRGRVRQLHVKDIKPTTATNFALSMESTEVGAGSLDWHSILTTAHHAGVRHYYVEQEPPFALPRFDAIRRSYDYLAQLRA